MLKDALGEACFANRKASSLRQEQGREIRL